MVPTGIPKEANSVVAKGVEEAGVGVCPRVLIISVGSPVTGLTETVALTVEASEVLGTLVCVPRMYGSIVVGIIVGIVVGIVVAIVVFSGTWGLTV